MATITNSIGSSGGRDYSTIALWEAALPANAVTAGNSYVGECYNDSEFVVAGTVVTFAGTTTDSTHTITLKCASGQSFKDNANAQTNALRYNQANGVGIRSSNNNPAIVISEAWVSLVGLQIAYDGTFTAAQGAVVQSTSLNGLVINQCICVNTQSTSQAEVLRLVGSPSSGTPPQVLNSLIIQGGSNYSPSGVSTNQATATFANCTIVAPSDRSTSGTQYVCKDNGHTYYGNVSFTNCALFGFHTAVLNSIDGTNVGSNNATDFASVGFGTSNQVSKTYASQFVNTTYASGDFKTKAAADLLDNGATDTTDIPSAVDIVGTSRPQGSAWDIGAWELVTAGASFLAAWARGSNLPVIGTGHY